MDTWGESANAAAMTSPRKIWTERAVKTTRLTFAATAVTVYVAHVNARTGTTPRRDTAASFASVTTSAVIAPATNCVEVNVGPWADAEA